MGTESVDSTEAHEEKAQPISEAAETPEASRGYASSIYAVLLLLGLVAVGLYFWLQQQKQREAAEAAAKPKVQQLGGLVLSGKTGKHVGSVNLALVRSQENFDEALRLVSDFPRLEVLDLTGNSISSEQLKQVCQLRELTSLHLSNTTIDDAMAVHLGKLRSLTAIHLLGTSLTSESLETIGGLRQLEVLDLSETKISGDLAPLANLSNLNWLVLKNVSLEDDALETLSKLPALKRLTLASEQISEQQYRKLKKLRPDLRIDGMDPEEVEQQ